MVLVSHETTTAIGLLLKQKRPRHGQLSKLNHQVVERLVIGAVKTLLRITLHSLLVHLEFGVAILEEGVDLLSGCDTGIDVGLGRLGTHLLRG